MIFSSFEYFTFLFIVFSIFIFIKWFFGTSFCKLMNMNDKRSRVRPRDVFTKEGDFVVKDGVEVGKQLLLKKSRGYISYVRGENPYSFPYRIFPSDFDPDHTFSNISYPEIQVNGREIKKEEQLQYIDVYVNPIQSYQEKGYTFILEELTDQFPSFQDIDKGLIIHYVYNILIQNIHPF